MDFLIVNGKIVKTKETNLSEFIIDEPFSLSQKMWFGYGGIPLFSENIELLARQAAAMKMNLPREFENRRELFRITKRMLNKNKFYRSGHVTFQLFKTKNKSGFVVTSEPFSEFEFPFSEEGILLTFSNQKKLSGNDFNPFAFFSKPLWESTISELGNTHFHNSVFLNEKNEVCECAGANIFLIQKNEIITPPLNSGCYNDILRPMILDSAREIGLKTNETTVVKKSDLKKMDEIFIASELTGVQWVLGVENKRFLHFISDQIHNTLIENLKRKALD
ncbi:MAG: aminotransferase class IV [Bacteroidota bacterium]